MRHTATLRLALAYLAMSRADTELSLRGASPRAARAYVAARRACESARLWCLATEYAERAARVRELLV